MPAQYRHHIHALAVLPDLFRKKVYAQREKSVHKIPKKCTKSVRFKAMRFRPKKKISLILTSQVNKLRHYLSVFFFKSPFQP